MPKFEREVEIDAPVEKVWEILTNPTLWPKWFPGIDAISESPALSENTTFEWTKDAQTGTCTIVKMVPMKLLEIRTQLGNDKDAHVFKLRPSGGLFGLTDDECKVEYTLDTLMGGGILGNFVAGGNPKDMLRVKKAMLTFRKMVETM